MIIVGGGPVGLAAALELARFSVSSVVIERHDSISWHPKARNLNARTMEIARGWGSAVYRRLRGIDTPLGWKSPMRYLDTIVGQQVGQIETGGFEGPGPTISPALPIMSSQDLTEAILRDAAQATGIVDLRFGHQVTDVLSGSGDHDAEAAVAVRVNATGDTYTLAGEALVAADGVDSTVRRQLGIALNGEQGIHHFVNCYFRADIERHVGERRGVVLFVANPAAAGLLQPLDAHGRWLCQIGVSPDQWVRELWDAERVRSWVRGAVGVPDLDVEVKGVGLWQMNAAVADRWVAGRVVLCGDAAHQFPPTGGLGVNTGLQGMHNAMWKLAFCVRGLAGWSLLITYEDERRPPAITTIAQCLQNHRNLARLAAAYYYPASSDLSAEEAERESRRFGNHFGVEFGTVYHSTAVIADGTTPPDVEDSYSDYAPCATPGCRAPHVWLGDESEPVSTLDLFGGGFTVLTGPGGAIWRKAAAVAARDLGVPIASYAIGDPGLVDHNNTFFDLYGIGRDGAVLVRPDGYVAWRNPTGHCEGAPLIQAVRQILDRRAVGLSAEVGPR
ncbi:FAD-dependent monooxygenase [Mycobacterium intracellulare]|uniref:FAD-dependent monooxygenase n=1 Tax=Mycobacterium intracellulare TaxID=1767 RepID=UPI001EEEB68A|nr:FAD-dependent monooxygenase [Mycobacterium intracellulare]MEE3751892.1 FAD-dependent monooxygenase [Mycobacterium intracellulare]